MTEEKLIFKWEREKQKSCFSQTIAKRALSLNHFSFFCMRFQLIFQFMLFRICVPANVLIKCLFEKKTCEISNSSNYPFKQL